MKSPRHPLAAAALLGLLAVAPSAIAQLPDNQEIAYHIRQTPDDPESTIVFTVTLKLSAHSRTGNTVVWDLLQATFEQFGAANRTWVDTGAAFDTGDGRWEIAHADGMEPVTSEFVLPPRLTGTAAPTEQGYAALDYDYIVETYTPPAPPAQPPYGDNTAAAAVHFLAGSETVIDSESQVLEVTR